MKPDLKDTSSGPKVSIIVPVYNAEKYIGNTIKSVLEQSYTNWELILIDDGSTDHTRKIIDKYLHDERITYFYQENNGQGSARNQGLRKSNGAYIAFLDADDLWDAHKLRSQIQLLQRKNISLVFSKIRCIDHRENYLGNDLGSGAGIYRGFQAMFLLAAGSISIPNSSVVATKESIFRAGCFDEKDEIRNMEDYDLWFRMLLSGSVFLGVEEVTGSYRKHRDQSTYSDRGQHLKMIHYLKNMCKDYPERKVYFRFLIIHRLLSYYNQQDKTEEAKNTCLQTYFSTSCIESYQFEKYLIDFLNLNNYLKFRELMVRRFRRLKTFVQSIDD